MEPLTPEQEARLADVWRLRMEGTKAAKKMRNDDAEALYWQALRLYEEVLGEDDPGIADSLCALIYEFGCHGRYAEAEPLIDRSLILLRQKPRPEHRGILRTLDGLASLCRERGHFGEANQYYKRVLAVREELLGPSHPRVAATRRRYAVLLQEMERESDTRQVRYNGDGESK